MKTYILVGEVAVNHFQNEDWQELEESIEICSGDLIAWDKKTDKVSTLLDMLDGWNKFIELSAEDLKNIEANTKIEIDYSEKNPVQIIESNEELKDFVEKQKRDFYALRTKGKIEVFETEKQLNKAVKKNPNVTHGVLNQKNSVWWRFI